MDRLSLKAEERNILGKKVKNLRSQGFIPGHVFGKNLETEHVLVTLKDFLSVMHQAGETGLIDLRVGAEKVRPVLIRDTQYDPVKGALLHIDFYQVNLSEKVKVPVPIVVLGGEELESVKIGENVILQNLSEVEVEALPTDLIEKIEVNVSHFKNVDDAVTIEQLSIDRSKLTVLADPEEIVVKLAPAITEEMKKLMEEQEAEAKAAAEAQAEEVEGAKEGEEVIKEGEEGAVEQPEAGSEAIKEQEDKKKEE